MVRDDAMINERFENRTVDPRKLARFTIRNSWRIEFEYFGWRQCKNISSFALYIYIIIINT